MNYFQSYEYSFITTKDLIKQLKKLKKDNIVQEWLRYKSWGNQLESFFYDSGQESRYWSDWKTNPKMHYRYYEYDPYKETKTKPEKFDYKNYERYNFSSQFTDHKDRIYWDIKLGCNLRNEIHLMNLRINLSKANSDHGKTITKLINRGKREWSRMSYKKMLNEYDDLIDFIKMHYETINSFKILDI